MAFEIKKANRTIFVDKVIVRLDSETDFSKWTFDKVVEGCVKIKDATPLLAMKNSDYVRRILLEGKLEGIFVRARGRRVWLISRDSITFYKQHKSKQHSHRRYIMKLNEVDEPRVRTALDALGIFYELKLAYKRKPRRDDAEGWIF